MMLCWEMILIVVKNLEHASSLIHVKDEYIKELKEKITKMNKEIVMNIMLNVN